MRVLLVDDSDSVRLTLGAILEDAGHVVVEASSLAAARQCALNLLAALYSFRLLPEILRMAKGS